MTSTQTNSDQRFDGKVVVITGAGGGIAAGIVERFAQLGAKLALLEVTPEFVTSLETRLREAGVEFLSVQCDVSDEASVIAAARLVRERFGRCDVLVNNAGILSTPTAIEKETVEVWDRVMAVNVRSLFLCTRAFGDMMLAQGHGSIVNIGSVAAYGPNASPPYGASKAAVLAFTRHVAVEWGPRGIRANSVSPGFVRTPLSERLYASEPEFAARRRALVPQRRLGSPADIANAVAYLASDAASYINGEDLLVDGGFLRTTLLHAQPTGDQYGGRES